MVLYGEVTTIQDELVQNSLQFLDWEVKPNHISANNPIKSILSKFWAISGAEFEWNLYSPCLYVYFVQNRIE